MVVRIEDDVLIGRGLEPGDLEPWQNAVGASAVGRLFEYVGEEATAGRLFESGG